MNPIQSAINILIERARDAVADGHITASEAFGLCVLFINQAVHAAEALGSGTGPQKKQAVLDALGQMYDDVIEPLDLPINDMVEPFVDKGIKQAVLLAAGGVIEASVRFLRADKSQAA